jgi:hypothetical protein
MVFGQFQSPYLEIFGSGGDLLGPVPQVLLGIAMLMVLFENERNAVQENALAFSTLGVDPMRLLARANWCPASRTFLIVWLRRFPPVVPSSACQSGGARCCLRCSVVSVTT